MSFDQKSWQQTNIWLVRASLGALSPFKRLCVCACVCVSGCVCVCVCARVCVCCDLSVNVKRYIFFVIDAATQ